MPRIYADFHSLGPSPRDPSRSMVLLDGLGSLRDLCNAGLRLREGLPITVWSDSADDEDLEVDAVVHYDPGRGGWIAELVDEIEYVPVVERATVFVCIECRADVSALAALPTTALVTAACARCGTLIVAAIAPP